MNRCVVLYEDWQFECCGEAYAVGENVKWLVLKVENIDIPIKTDKIDYYYEAHSSDYKKLFVLEGKINKIKALKNILIPIANAYGSTIIKILVAFLFIFFLEFADMVQSGYTGIILGHRKNSCKIGFSVIIGFASYIGTQIIAIAMLFVIGLFNKELMNLFITNEIISVEVIRTIIYISIAIYTLILLIVYFINLKLFKKGVNVD